MVFSFDEANRQADTASKFLPPPMPTLSPFTPLLPAILAAAASRDDGKGAQSSVRFAVSP